MPTATMTSKGQITLPKEVREKLRLVAGSKDRRAAQRLGWRLLA